MSFDNGSGEVGITDPQHMLALTVPGASGGGTHPVRVPRTAFTGSLTLDTGAGNDSLQLQRVPMAARVNTGDGDDTILVLSTSAALTIDGGAGADALAVGSTQAGNNGDLDTIAGPITIVGGANPVGRSDTLYVNDRSESAQVGYLADQMEVDYTAQLPNAEINALYQGRHASWLVGVRYINLGTSTTNQADPTRTPLPGWRFTTSSRPAACD